MHMLLQIFLKLLDRIFKGCTNQRSSYSYSNYSFENMSISADEQKENELEQLFLHILFYIIILQTLCRHNLLQLNHKNFYLKFK